MQGMSTIILILKIKKLIKDLIDSKTYKIRVPNDHAIVKRSFVLMKFRHTILSFSTLLFLHPSHSSNMMDLASLIKFSPICA